MKMKVICIMMCLILIANILPVSGLMAVSETKEEEVVAVSGENDWPMIRNNPENTGYSTSSAPSRQTVRWSRSILGPNRNSYIPVVANGKVYVTTAEGIRCYNANMGRKLWDYEGNGVSYMTIPAVVNNKVYFGSYGAEKYLYCLDADTGSLIWKEFYHILSSPTIVDGDIFFGNSYGEILCVDAESGELEWMQQIGGEDELISSTPTVVNGRVYVAFYSMVYCLDATNGQELWNYNATHGNNHNKIYGSPVFFNDKIYVSNNRIHCIDANDGELEWSYSADEGKRFSGISIAYGKVYFGNGPYCNDKFYCLDAVSGELVWEISMIYPVGSPAVADNKVYIGALGSLYCLNSDNGEQIWKKGIDTNADSLCFAIAGGYLYTVGSSLLGFKLICFGSKLKNIDRSASGLFNGYLMEKMLHLFHFLRGELKPYL